MYCVRRLKGGFTDQLVYTNFAVASSFQDEIFLVGGIDQKNERKRLESLNLTTMG